jgi:HlyD family secretion protein
MVRQVHGPGTLVPVDIRWIAARTQGRVERIVLLPGAIGRAGQRHHGPQQPRRDAGRARHGVAAQGRRGRARQPQGHASSSDVLQSESEAASAKANFEQARLTAQVNEQLFKDGLVSELDLQRCRR